MPDMSHPVLSTHSESSEESQPGATTATTLATLTGEINALLTAARPRLLHLARLQGLSPETAEDVAQEASLIVWRSLDQLRTPARFDAWVDGIARNIGRRYLREQRTEHARHAALLYRGPDT